jgi:uncharacterized membrane protein
MNINNFLSKSEKEKILKTIRDAERQTSGEIRVHLDKKCDENLVDRTVYIFNKLKMHETRLRNGTLIYLAVRNKKFAVYGDKGINEVVPENFWEDVKEEMREHFIKDDLARGLVVGISRIGEKLKEFFPYKDDDINELPDEISTG